MSKKVFYKVNHFIQAPQLRVLDDLGHQVGVMSKADALAKAQEMGIDLVEVAPLANPPVAKLIDFAKFKYQLQQKKQEEKKKNKTVEIKEIRFTPFIGPGDFDVRIKKATEYLKDGNKVKLVVKFTGREITRKNFGDAVLEKAVKALEGLAKVEMTPRLVGKNMFMQLAPSGKKKIESTDTQSNEEE
ncbi:translation initiation factor IF-3 [Candidatus Cerribacteria bacterium 'Amazon FNV 2010 28 9']|uniref:Translation initiation factor IF-3 n=1 Tax=Candidatus Cerribacteria bacterium 'Amazon FNV 2010 28 9' TaxID=2081795 RepID=A0A317JNN6_9BACT|nr:MAG: translation initiation factor IF-3 [Candidatus Cerribacteria bacterium 'Amazon FNV 2010 28 9']